MFSFYERLPPLVRVSLRHGLIAGILGPFLYITLYYIGDHPATVTPVLDFRLLLFSVFFFFCLKELRDAYFGGVLYFWQGMLACLMVTVMFALLSAFGIYLFGKWNPAFVTSFVALEAERVKLVPAEEIKKIGEDVFEAMKREMASIDAGFMARRYFVQSFWLSFFISIIISVILRRQPVNS